LPWGTGLSTISLEDLRAGSVLALALALGGSGRIVGPLGGSLGRVEGADQLDARGQQGGTADGDGAEDAADTGAGRQAGHAARGDGGDAADGRADRGADEAADGGADAELAGEVVLRALVLDRRGDQLDDQRPVTELDALGLLRGDLQDGAVLDDLGLHRDR